MIDSLLVCSQIVTADWKSSVYVALGDSFSSGEGNPPFIAGTDGPSNYCHRSTEAYSQVLSEEFGLQLKFYACSGAVTGDVITNIKYGELPQLNHPEVSSAGLITMTIGGNDARFSNVLEACIAQKLKADAINAAIGEVGGPVLGPVSIWLGLGLDPSCANYQNFTSSLNNRIIRDVYPAVKGTYEKLLDIVDPKNTSIIVANYPHLFPDSSSEQGCLALSLFVTPENQKYFNDATDLLDSKLETAASEVGVNLVDVRPIFTGHGICGKEGSWINGVTIAAGSQCTYSAFGQCIIPEYSVNGSFHPNASGHTDGYAIAIENYINSGTNPASQSYLANPQALTHFPAATDTTAVVVKELTTEPVTSGSAVCEGTYQAGQQVLVSGEGFMPGGSVQLYVSSQGLGPVIEQQVGQLTADSSGHVAGSIRIPLNATGFTPSGSKAGLVFIDAIGLGPDGAHVDNLAMVGLAPHGSSCEAVEPFNNWLPLVLH